MATRKASVRVQKDSHGFTAVLASAVFEWLLIFLLFVEAFFSYLVTRFAHFFELQTPCLFCSRLDHILGSEKPGFYWDLLCQAHKLEISSLVYCHIHRKLIDIRCMCEGCISLFSTNKTAKYETDRLSMGKLGSFIEYFFDDKHNICLKLSTTVDGEELENHLLLKDTTIGSLGLRHCSCCDEPLRNNMDAQISQRSQKAESTGAGTAEVDISGSCSMTRSRLHRREILKKRREKPSVSTTVSYLGDAGFDPLSHVGYTELKITSDSESEVPISDDDDGISLAREASDVNIEFVARCLQLESGTSLQEKLPKTLSSDFVVEKHIHQAPMSVPSLLVPSEQIHACKPHGVSSLTSVVSVGHDLSHGVSSVTSVVSVGCDLEELDWNQVEEKGNHPTPASSRQLFPAISELISPCRPPLLADAEKPLVAKEKYAMICYRENVSIMENREVKLEDTSTTSDFKSDMALNEDVPLIPSSMDLNGAYKLAVSNKASHPLFMGKDSSTGYEDLKLLLSQISAARGFELSWNDMIPSPRLLGHAEDVKTSEASSSAGTKILNKRLSMERTESGIESLDGSLVIEGEGESMIDQLKQQIELDRKSLNALYKELEEERSAAAIAANQAMAMINRLQEEKATMQMEALQYQRMMEEQAEYDQEALQKLNDLLTERGKEIQDLEAELEDYRKGFWNELTGEKIPGPVDNPKEVGVQAICHNSHSDDCPENNRDENPGNGDLKGSEMGVLKDTLLEFEDEKLCILKCLQSFQKDLHISSDNGVYYDLSGVNGNREGFPDIKCKDTKQPGFSKENVQKSLVSNAAENGRYSREEEPQGNDREWPEEVKKHGEGLRGNDTALLNQHEVTQGNNQIGHGRQSGMASSITDLVVIVKEISQVIDRLKTFEAERNLLVHSINSFQNGNEGLQFIQEIASHLREVRRIGTRNREQAVA